MKTNPKMSFTGGVKNRFFGVALFTVVAFGVLFTACGGGGGGGGGSASNASGTTWGGKTTITIPFGGGTGRASVSEGFKKLGCTSIDLTVTQTANGTSEVIYEETISPDEDVTIEVITGSKIDATATLIIQDKDPRTATGSIDRVAVGKNTLTLYVEYTYALMDDSVTPFAQGEYTSLKGLELPATYYDESNNKTRIVTEFTDTPMGGGKPYPPGMHHDITGDVELYVMFSPLYVSDIGEGRYIGCNGAVGNTVTIPAKAGNITINGIASSGFSYLSELQTVIIENGIESIDTSAFEGCTNLTSVSIPATVTQIGNDAFMGTGISAVTLPEGLMSIGSGAFDTTSISSVRIPDTVTSIGNNAFGFCPLQSVTMPAFANEFMDLGSLFSNCGSLTDIYFTTDIPPSGIASQGVDPHNITIYYPSSGNSSAWENTFDPDTYGFTVVPY